MCVNVENEVPCLYLAGTQSHTLAGDHLQVPGGLEDGLCPHTSLLGQTPMWQLHAA